jgi:hypothetical protein
MKIEERDELLMGHMNRVSQCFDSDMTDADRQKAAEINQVRILILGSIKLHGLTDAVAEKILELSLWKVFGYSRLGDYLDLELGVPHDLTVQWVQEAVRRGVEDKMIYIGPLIYALMERDCPDELAGVG